MPHQPPKYRGRQIHFAMSSDMQVAFDAEKAKMPYITDAQLARELVTKGLKYDKLLAAKLEMEEMYNPSDLPEPWV